jgi:DNA-binding transcriptional MerR regulator
MPKAQDAFRTISEVADELAVQKHVLRFWENKFPHIRPMKRGGGRRFYRPDDLDLLRGIRYLLHREGYTIKGVQKILREQGPDHVKSCWQIGLSAEPSADPPVVAPSAAPSSVKSVSGKVGQSKGGQSKEGRAKPLEHLDLVAQLDTMVAELEAAQSILRGKALPRRQISGRPQPPVIGAKTLGSVVTGKMAPKKARGR